MIAYRFGTAEELGPRDVHVWVFHCRQNYGPLVEVLDHDERDRAARFATTELRDAFVVQHVVTRLLLAQYAMYMPGEHIERGPRGKPRGRNAPDGRPVRFNLSHADDLALLAVSRELEVGIDIERYDAPIEPARLARIVLAPDEAACIDKRAFMRVWCRKEACLKATGVGLLDDLTSVSVMSDRVSIVGDDDTMHDVYLQDLIVDGDHVAALATSSPCAAIDFAVEQTAITIEPTLPAVVALTPMVR